MEPQTSAGLTEMFDLLTHLRRRYVLYYLTQESDVVNIDALAGEIARREGEVTERSPTTRVREIETALYHTHLPKLADAGFITFGANGDAVELAESPGIDGLLSDTAPIDGYALAAADD